MASPPGTFAAYLSLSCADVARPPSAASHTVATPIVSMLLRFIEAPRAHETRRARRDPSDEGIDETEIRVDQYQGLIDDGMMRGHSSLARIPPVSHGGKQGDQRVRRRLPWWRRCRRSDRRWPSEQRIDARRSRARARRRRMPVLGLHPLEDVAPIRRNVERG